MTHKRLDEDALTRVLLGICDIADNMKYDVDSPLNDSTTLLDATPPTRLEENTVLLNSETDNNSVLGSDDIDTSAEMHDYKKLKALKVWGYKDE